MITAKQYAAAFRSPLAYGLVIGAELGNLPSRVSFNGVAVWVGNVLFLYVLGATMVAIVKALRPYFPGFIMAGSRLERVIEWWVATLLVTVAILPLSTAQVRAIGCWAAGLGIIAIAETVKMRRSGGVQ
ncbi:hypothetical protein [Novosphingobium sp. BL-52-GroH]|uniref:hypothetical protein n=1 Tax=Novosphingobium sp. BL-52-GroH TaxID=3349877 RepID=UPI00384BA4E9